MEPNGTIIGQLTNREVYDIAKARDTFSPDFCNLVYNKEDQRGVIQIWNQDLRYRAALPQQLSFIRNGYAFAPVWSPDYKRVAYVGVEGEQQDIFAWDWDDKKSWRLTRATDWWWNQFPSYSPDGKKIVYSSDQGHDATFSEIWIMDWDGANPRNMGNGVWNAYNPVWIKWHR
jgi:Tol biopolymer transport system component